MCAICRCSTVMARWRKSGASVPSLSTRAALVIAAIGLRSSCDRMARNCSRCFTASRISVSARLRSDTSRSMLDMLAISPWRSRIGEAVTDTSTRLPSLRRRRVSSCCIASPRRTRVSASRSSPSFSAGTSRSYGAPIISPTE
jgi:hypothetical protein